MSKRDVSFYIVDVFIAIDKIKRYIKEFKSVDELLYSELHWDATIRELEIIGEATKHILKDEIIDSKYRRIVDFRNQITHGYFGIDENIVWDVLQNKLPQYQNDLKEILLRLDIDLNSAIKHAKGEYGRYSKILKVLCEQEKMI